MVTSNMEDCVNPDYDITDVATNVDEETADSEAFTMYLMNGNRILFYGINKQNHDAQPLGYISLNTPAERIAFVGSKLYISTSDSRIMEILPDIELTSCENQ